MEFIARILYYGILALLVAASLFGAVLSIVQPSFSMIASTVAISITTFTWWTLSQY